MANGWLAAILRFFPAGCISLFLLYTFRLYDFTYFYLDDINNLALTQRLTGWEILWSNTHPSDSVYRPFAYLVYWAWLNFFGFTPLPYHVLFWTLHMVNVFMVYLILRHASQSAYAASLASLLFASQLSYSDIFYNGTTILELLAGFWFFLGLLIYMRMGGSRSGLWLAWIIYFLASNSKEMALTLPAFWLFYDWVVRPDSTAPNYTKKVNGVSQFLRYLALRFAVPALIGLWFLYSKRSMLTGTSPSDPYHMGFSLQTLGRGYGWYFNALHQTDLSWPAWIILSILLLCFLFLTGSRWGVFFLAYVFLTLLPVVFMESHRFPHYWYIPFLGIAGLAALAIKPLAQLAGRKMSPQIAAIAGMLFFAVACNQYYLYQKNATSHGRNWARELSEEYRSFITGLESLGEPDSKATVYFQSVPRFFDSGSAAAALQLVFRRTDLNAEIVEHFPPGAKYRVRFENSKVIVARE